MPFAWLLLLPTGKQGNQSTEYHERSSLHRGETLFAKIYLRTFRTRVWSARWTPCQHPPHIFAAPLGCNKMSPAQRIRWLVVKRLRFVRALRARPDIKKECDAHSCDRLCGPSATSTMHSATNSIRVQPYRVYANQSLLVYWHTRMNYTVYDNRIPNRSFLVYILPLLSFARLLYTRPLAVHIM